MFSNRTVNPSPNRTSIKEANDHLQLLHQRVMELESTTQEQNEALKQKDELLHATVAEISMIKDKEIQGLTTLVSQLSERIKKLETLVKEKDSHIEQLNHRCLLADDVAAYTPTVEKLLSAMKKLPCKYNKHTPSRSKTKSSRSHNSTKSESRKSITSLDTSYSHDMLNAVDGHASVPNQSFADLRIGRSFNINSNFSLSEDEIQSEIL